MKFLIFAAVIAIASADVSHLNRNYLPPDHQHQHQHVHHEISQAISGDSYTPGHLFTEQQQYTADIPQAIGVDSYTPGHFAVQEDSAVYGVENNAPEHYDVSAPIGGGFNSPAHLAVQQSVDIQEFNGDNHIPSLVYGPAAVQDTFAQFASHAQPQVVHHQQQHDHHHQDAAVGIDTQYGSNGGYIY